MLVHFYVQLFPAIFHVLLRDVVVCVCGLEEDNFVVRSPSTVHNIQPVKSVQRRFTKRLSGPSDSERLKHLSIPSSELCHLHRGLFWCYKIIFGLVQVNLLDSPVLSSC